MAAVTPRVPSRKNEYERPLGTSTVRVQYLRVLPYTYYGTELGLFIIPRVITVVLVRVQYSTVQDFKTSLRRLPPYV